MMIFLKQSPDRVLIRVEYLLLCRTYSQAWVPLEHQRVVGFRPQATFETSVQREAYRSIPLESYGNGSYGLAIVDWP